MVVRPAPLTCPQCLVTRDEWVWNEADGEWDWDDEWWRDPAVVGVGAGGYTCSRWCYRDRVALSSSA